MNSKKFKVGIVSSNITRNAGGVFDVMKAHAEQFNQMSFLDVEVFSVDDPSGNNREEEWRGIHTRIAKRVGPRSIGYAPSLSNMLCEDGLDIVHLHGLWMYPSVAVSNWRSSVSRPHVVSPHGMLDSWALGNSGWKKKIAYWGFERNNLVGAKCIHALNESEYDSIRAFGLNNPVCVIPNGINLPSHGKLQRPSWMSDIPADAKVLLYLGRIHPKKGLVPLLNAWSACAGVNEANSWHLVVAGWDQGGHESELRSIINESESKSRVHFVGPKFGDDKMSCYVHADAFILPSFSEGLPMVVLEAWAYGLPVLMTKQCNLPEGFEFNCAMEVLPDAADLRVKLEAVFRMPEAELKCMGDNGQKLVKERFTWSKVAQQFSSVYKWILGRSDMPDCVRLD